MNFFIEKIKEYWKALLIILLLLVIGVFMMLNKKDASSKNEESIALESYSTSSEEILSNKLINVDVKGRVKKPGVYQLLDSAIVNDAIISAGGFLKDAYTDNINLSKKVEDELVIFVYSKKEMSKTKSNSNSNKVCYASTYDIKGCTDNSSSIITTNSEKAEVIENTISNGEKSNSVSNDKNGKISINNASMDELTTLDGIGEAKAKSIIEYRNTNGLFKTIEDIMNVSGIGESAFEKIKDNITI